MENKKIENKEIENKEMENKENKEMENKHIKIYKLAINSLKNKENKENINNTDLNNLIINEIELLNKIIKNKENTYNLIKIDDKPSHILINNEYSIYTMIGYSIITNRRNKDLNKIVNKLENIKIKPYKKENRIFFRIYDGNDNRILSDIRLLIMNYKTDNILKRDSNKIIKSLLKEKKIKNKKEKKIEILEI